MHLESASSRVESQSRAAHGERYIDRCFSIHVLLAMQFCGSKTGLVTGAMTIPVYGRDLVQLKGQTKPGFENELPLEKHKHQFMKYIDESARIGVRASPGCGKSLLLPEWLYCSTPNEYRGRKFAVLVAQPTVLACQRLVKSLTQFKQWSRYSIQLRTGADTKDSFCNCQTMITVVTYGILFQWISGNEDTREKMLRRYNCFLLDEFATEASSKYCPGRLPPDMEQIATVLSHVVSRPNWTHSRLVVASAALNQNQVRKTLMTSNVKFLEAEDRRFDVGRKIAAPVSFDNMIPLIVERVVQALKINDGNILVFLPGLHEILDIKKECKL